MTKKHMDIEEQEIEQVKDFISRINSMKSSAVIVEGKNDSLALRELGCKITIIEFHRFSGLIDFTDNVSEYKEIILLFDSDKKGRYLTKRIIEQLLRRTKINLEFRKRLTKITRGEIKQVEDLKNYSKVIV